MSFASECPAPPSYYKIVCMVPEIPDDFDPREQYNNLFAVETDAGASFETELVSSVRERMKSVLNHLVTDAVKPCVYQGEQQKAEKQAKLSNYIDEMYSVLKALRRRQALQHLGKELRHQIKDLQDCEADLQISFSRATELMKNPSNSNSK